MTNARLTPLGRELARLPLDPRIGRIVLAARDGGCLAEALVIASALAVPDPRERPLERQQAADQAHLRVSRRALRFPVAGRAVGVLRRALGAEAVAPPAGRRLPRAVRFVPAPARMARRASRSSCAAARRGGLEVVADSCRRAIDAARYATLHKARARGTARQHRRQGAMTTSITWARAACASTCIRAPGSRARRRRKWMLAAELTETSRLFARCAAKVEPEWIEEVAGDRVTRDYFEPHWEEKRGEVVASERVSALRPHARRAPARVVRRASIPRRRARCSSARRWCRRAGDHAGVPRAQPTLDRRGRGARAQGAPAGRAGRRRNHRARSTRNALPAGIHSLARVRALARTDAKRKRSARAVPDRAST